MSVLPRIDNITGRGKEKTVFVNADALVETLKKIENNNFNRIERTRVAILKKLFEELAYPPADIVGTADWFEERANVSLQLSEVTNLLVYVKVFMPVKYGHPKYAIAQLIEYCCLRPPKPFEQPIWTERLTKLQRGHVPLESMPSVKDARRPSMDNQLSKLFSYINTKWNYSRAKQINDMTIFEETESPTVRAVAIIHGKPRAQTTQTPPRSEIRRRTIGKVYPFQAYTSSSQFSDIGSMDENEGEGSMDALDDEPGGITDGESGESAGPSLKRMDSTGSTKLKPLRVNARKPRRHSA
jgi:hypothetical protein